MHFVFYNAVVSVEPLEAWAGHSGDYITFPQLIGSTGFGRMDFLSLDHMPKCFYVPRDLLFFLLPSIFGKKENK